MGGDRENLILAPNPSPSWVKYSSSSPPECPVKRVKMSWRRVGTRLDSPNYYP